MCVFVWVTRPHFFVVVLVLRLCIVGCVPWIVDSRGPSNCMSLLFSFWGIWL